MIDDLLKFPSKEEIEKIEPYKSLKHLKLFFYTDSEKTMLGLVEGMLYRQAEDWQRYINNKIGKLKVSYLLAKTNLLKQKDRLEKLEGKDIRYYELGFWSSFFVEYFYSLFFSIWDIIFQILNILLNTNFTRDNTRLKNVVKKKLNKYGYKKISDKINEIESNDIFKNSRNNRHCFMHRFSPLEQCTVKIIKETEKCREYGLGGEHIDYELYEQEIDSLVNFLCKDIKNLADLIKKEFIY